MSASTAAAAAAGCARSSASVVAMTSVYVTATTERVAWHHPPLDHSTRGGPDGDQDGDGGVAGRPSHRQRDVQQRVRRDRRRLLVQHAIRGGAGHQPGGADRRGARELLLDAAVAASSSEGGNPPDSVRTEARVQILKQGEGFGITRIELATVGRVPGIDQAAFQQAAQAAKEICPISKALAAVPEITVEARLEGASRRAWRGRPAGRPRLAFTVIEGRPQGSCEDRVLVRVRRRAAAEQHERLGAVVDELVLGAGRDDDAVAGADRAPPRPPRIIRPGARGEEVDLLGRPVVVRLGRRARRHGRLGERLVGRVAGGDAGELADLRAVERDERLALLQPAMSTAGSVTGPPPGGEGGPAGI